LQIPPYQIQNVLRLYFRQLGEGKILDKPRRSVTRALTLENTRPISSEGTRQGIIDKVAAGIVTRIITEGAKKETPYPVFGRPRQTSAGQTICQRSKNRFTYTLVDRHNNRKIQTAKDIQADSVQAGPDD
jgi:hypothetical protein